MNGGRPTIWKISQRLSVVLITLWWGGLNCLSGCLIAPITDSVAEAHCSMEGGECCVSKNDVDRDSGDAIGSLGEAATSISCCSLESLAADSNRRLDDATALIAPHDTHPELIPQTQVRVVRLDRWARLPDRGGTYVLHCVFLI